MSCFVPRSEILFSATGFSWIPPNPYHYTPTWISTYGWTIQTNRLIKYPPTHSCVIAVMDILSLWESILSRWMLNEWQGTISLTGASPGPSAGVLHNNSQQTRSSYFMPDWGVKFKGIMPIKLEPHHSSSVTFVLIFFLLADLWVCAVQCRIRCVCFSLSLFFLQSSRSTYNITLYDLVSVRMAVISYTSRLSKKNASLTVSKTKSIVNMLLSKWDRLYLRSTEPATKYQLPKEPPLE